MISGFNYGWICPKCGSVYSPTQTECYKCGPITKYELTSTTVVLNDYNNWREREEQKFNETDRNK